MTTPNPHATANAATPVPAPCAARSAENRVNGTKITR